MPDRLIEHVVGQWEVIALGAGTMRSSFESLEPTWRSLVVIALAVGLGFVLQTAVQNWRGVPSQITAERARVDSIAASHRALIDSVDVASLRRSERTHAELREVRDITARTQALLDDLVCVLSAQAQGRDPQSECRPPLPLVPWPQGG